MSSISHGMNVNANTGQVVPGPNREAQDIERTATDVDRLLQQVEANWKGNDARQFQQKWTGQYRNQLKRLAEELKQLADTARRNADNQRSTSSTL